ncbi:hypothetical protein M707_23910 [Arthrobacter sp. AK-YN10]|nr:hypothetical protein M707_23910 [Arthrobacter sp. AK-YN10]
MSRQQGLQSSDHELQFAFFLFLGKLVPKFERDGKGPIHKLEDNVFNWNSLHIRVFLRNGRNVNLLRTTFFLRPQ